MARITGGDPLNSTFRTRLTGFVQRAARTWLTPPAAAQVTVADPQATAQQAVSAAMERMRELRREAGGGKAPPVVAGAGWPVLLDPVLQQVDRAQQERFSSDDAKYGRVSTTYGVTPQAYADAGAATNTTLEKIASYHYEADHQGLLYRKSDMDFAIGRKDSTIAAAQRARTSPVYRARLQFAPADPSPLAYAVCAAVRRIVERIPDFCAAEDNALSAAGHGYSGLEVVYKPPADLTVAVSSRRSVTIRDVCGVASLESVHPRDFRWAPIARTMLLDTGAGRYVDPYVSSNGVPTDKLIFHSAAGLGDPAQRGYYFAAAPLHMLKFQGVARWSVMLELFGIATPYMVYGGEQEFADDGDIRSALRFLGLLGRGKPALLAQKFGKVEQTQTPTGVDARGQHAAIIGVVNSELLRLIQGQVLSSEVGGSASYALANVQQTTLEDVQIADAVRWADTSTHQLVVFIVRQNLRQFARAFGATPAQVMAVTPRAYRTIDKRIDPAARLTMCATAAKPISEGGLGLPVDMPRVAEELGIPLVQTEPAEDVPGEREQPGDQQEQQEAQTESAAPGVDLTATAQAAVVKVDEARAAMGLGPLGTEEGALSVAEFMARHSGTIADAAAAEQGDPAQEKQDDPGAA